MWYEARGRVLFGVVDICSGGEAAQGGSHSDGADCVVWFEFGGERGREDGVEGVGGEVAVCDSVDDDGEVFYVVGGIGVMVASVRCGCRRDLVVCVGRGT